MEDNRRRTFLKRGKTNKKWVLWTKKNSYSACFQWDLWSEERRQVYKQKKIIRLHLLPKLFFFCYFVAMELLSWCSIPRSIHMWLRCRYSVRFSCCCFFRRRYCSVFLLLLLLLLLLVYFVQPLITVSLSIYIFQRREITFSLPPAPLSAASLAE